MWYCKDSAKPCICQIALNMSAHNEQQKLHLKLVRKFGFVFITASRTFQLNCITHNWA